MSAILVSLIPVLAVANADLRNSTMVGVAVVALLMCYVVSAMLRHRFRISIRAMLAFIAMLSIAFAMLGNRMFDAWKQRQAVRSVVNVGGTVHYDYTTGFDGAVKTSSGLMLPTWMMDICGKDVFAYVSGIELDVKNMSDEALRQVDFHDFPFVDIRGIRLSGASHEALGTLSHLRALCLVNTGTSDKDIKALANLTNLESLDLVGIPITDDGLAVLEGLPKLRTVHLKGSSTTTVGRSRLKERVPGCRVVYDETPASFVGSPPF